MRELTNKEMKEVSGGNPGVAAYLGVVGVYLTGKYIGGLVNQFNYKVSGMSLGEAAYRTIHH